MNGFDQEILQDFLTESGELLEQLDKDLVLLEQSPRDPELLNRVFRALHTIKGSASFLQLTNLVSVAHAAESALNAARNGQVVVGKEAMDLLLAAVDVIKRQFGDLSAGRALAKAGDDLVAGLTAIGEGRSPSAAGAGAGHGTETDSAIGGLAAAHGASGPTATRTPLLLSDNKLMLVEFLVSDLRETVAKVERSIGQMGDAGARSAACVEIAEHADALLKHAQFFDFTTMRDLAQALYRVAGAGARLSAEQIAQVTPRLAGIVWLIREQAEGLGQLQLVTRPVHGLCHVLEQIAGGEELTAWQVLAEGSTAEAALVHDGCADAQELGASASAAATTNEHGTAAAAGMLDAAVMEEQTSVETAAATTAAVPAATDAVGASVSATATVQAIAETLSRGGSGSAVAAAAQVAAAMAAATDAPANTMAGAGGTGGPAGTAGGAAAGAAGAQNAAAQAGAAQGAGAQVEQTIRVEVGRLEALLNLVGELVLQKNRISSIARQAVALASGPQELRDQIGMAAGQLDRVTGDIQVAVMRTRMQPLDKLFGKYPRLIRDLARKTGKDIHLEIEGGETEVDKSVIEELGDPLVHIMRNSADHGIETPEERRAAGKGAQGTIRLSARHEGSHVVIRIQDDGRGLSRARISRKAVERGLHSEQDLARMSDREVNQIIFAAGFSTADKVTDLSGRGVGMDVVRTNIEKIKGVIELESAEGQGTTIVIRIPLTVAIMTAMMVGVGDETYAIPLSSITEIVKPEGTQLGSVNGHPVLRLRDRVLPLLSACDLFELQAARRAPTPFAVICGVGDKRVGVQVSRLIGQQEVVVKPLDGVVKKAGPVSGATVRDDGGVSLIVDIAAVVRLGEQQATQRLKEPVRAGGAGSVGGVGGVGGTSERRAAAKAA